MTDMSAIVRSTVPALFIVPTSTFSPTSTLRRVTMPSNGDSNRACDSGVLAAHESGFLLPRLLFARLDFLLARPQLGLADVDLGLHPLERFARRQTGLPEILLALQVLAGEFEARLRALELNPRLLEPRPCRGQSGLVAAHRALGVDRIDLQEELALLDAVAFVDGEPRHAPHRLGADVDRLLGVDLARGRDDGLEVTLLHRFGRHARALRRLPGEIRTRTASDHEQRHQDEQPFPAEHGQYLVRDGRVEVTTSDTGNRDVDHDGPTAVRPATTAAKSP